MKISDVIITALLKKGFVYDAVNCDVEFDIPMNTDSVHSNTVKVKFKADRMSIKIEKGE